jgi:hypothetical protein
MLAHSTSLGALQGCWPDDKCDFACALRNIRATCGDEGVGLVPPALMHYEGSPVCMWCSDINDAAECKASYFVDFWQGASGVSAIRRCVWSGEDSEASCQAWAQAGECEKNPDFMVSACRASCGTGQCKGNAESVRCGSRHPVDSPPPPPDRITIIEPPPSLVLPSYHAPPAPAGALSSGDASTAKLLAAARGVGGAMAVRAARGGGLLINATVAGVRAVTAGAVDSQVLDGVLLSPDISLFLTAAVALSTFCCCFAAYYSCCLRRRRRDEDDDDDDDDEDEGDEEEADAMRLAARMPRGGGCNHKYEFQAI